MSGVPLDVDAIKAKINAARRKIAQEMKEVGLPGTIPEKDKETIPEKASSSQEKEGLKRKFDTLNNSKGTEGGLNVQLHPMLAAMSGDADMKKVRSLIPKRHVASTQANIRALERKEKLQEKKKIKKKPVIKVVEIPPEIEFSDPSKNPYFDTSILSKSAAAPKPRTNRVLKFAQKGKYIEQANQMRAKAHLEKLKQQIAETVRKSGMSVELDLVADQGIKKEAPPRVEWWDAPLLPTGDYDDMEQGRVILDDENTTVTSLIQHPIPIEPPHDLGPPPPRPVMLTKKERKKLRRQTRQEMQKEKQDKIRLGILPPPQPKVNIGNLMRVLGTEAIQDPTKIEAEVRAQMEARVRAGIKHNQDKKLTDEQRREKKSRKYADNPHVLPEAAVFRVKDLSNKSHQFKVDKNAQQYNLTGVAVIGPSFTIVVVEGPGKSIRQYKKLMLRRIDWNGQRNKGDDESDTEQDTSALKSTDACALVWEGQIKQRSFRNFRTHREVPSEARVAEIFDKLGVGQYWNAARNYVSQVD